MGEIILPHKIELFDDEEAYELDDLNSNFRKLNDAIPQLSESIVAGFAVPEGKIAQRFKGLVTLTSGAGGQDKNAASATDAAGWAGIWFGSNGIPMFERVNYVSVNDAGNVPDFLATWTVQDINAQRIRIRGRRVATEFASQYANAYGGVSLFVEIEGW